MSAAHRAPARSGPRDRGTTYWHNAGINVRPSVVELLEGLERLLTEEVGPHVTAPHAREVLQNVVLNLDRLKRQWPALAGYLQWDNREIERLLAATLEPAQAVDPALAARIQETLAHDRREGEAA